MVNFSFWDRLVGDNIDHEILVRVQTKVHINRSIHWTHQFAVLDRVQEPEDCKRFTVQETTSRQYCAEKPHESMGCSRKPNCY